MEKEEENIDVAEIAEKLKKGYYVDYELLASPKIVKSLIEDYDITDVLKHSPLRKNEEFVLSMVKWNHLVIRDIPELNGNPEFMLKAVKVNIHALARASSELLQNPEFMIEIISMNPGIEDRLAVAKRFMENPEHEETVKNKRIDIKYNELHVLKEKLRAKKVEAGDLEKAVKEKKAEIAALRGGIPPKEEKDEETRE